MKTSLLRALVASLTLGAALAGCAGDPDLRADDPSVELDLEIDRVFCETAPPGCEGVDLEGSTLVACEGEALLGAVVTSTGQVACVDSVTILIEELDAAGLTPSSADPSPQPSHPGIHPRPGARRITAIRSDDGSWVSPTTVVRADPTPTPITQPLREDPTPTPVTRADPTPTPAMEN